MSVSAFHPMFSQHSYKSSDSLTVWLFIAAAFHAIVLIGLTFAPLPEKTVSKVIDITLVNSSAKKPPENAKYLAQANQIGAGVETQKPLPLAHKKPKAGKHRKNQQVAKSSVAQTAIEHRLVTRTKSEEKMPSAQKQEDDKKTGTAQQTQPEMSMEEIDKQIALLEAKLQKQKEAADKTRIKAVNQISAHKYTATQYVKEWVEKVQRTGNLNIPEINGRRDFSGSLILEVRIMYDGNIYKDPVIVKSSGIIALDEAAIALVKSMAPFNPLPEEITEELDVLSIQREWIFSPSGEITSYNDDAVSNQF